MRLLALLSWFLLLATVAEASSEDHKEGPHRYHVASVDFQGVSTPFIISLWIVIAGLAKIGFHVTPKLSEICPESCLLIVIGVVIGLLLFYTELIQVGPLTPKLFFLYLLPPIILDAGYYMPNRLFFDNLGAILLYAVAGTVWNALSIGLSLWGIGLTGLYGTEVPLLHALLFSSVISAVDPVAVLAVFEEIQVNEVLYILVFGESLLNDAVTVVLYHLFEGYAEMGMENIIPVDYVAGIASFFVVALGGTAMGIVWGFLGAFVSRFTHYVLIIEPIFVFVMAYLSYLSAELFHLSGILALTFCGITMKNYVEQNISHKSHVTVKYSMKMLANSSETIIFIFLGVSTVNDQHDWNTAFVLLTILFCSVYRAIGVFVQTALINRFRIHKVNMVEQFIMSYGGLRGAVAFALVLIVDSEVIPTKKMMVTTVISMVYFTVFLQGITIGPLVKCLGVSLSSKTELSLYERMNIRMMDHLMSAIEALAGHKIGNYKLRDWFRHYNERYFKPLLTRQGNSGRMPKIFETYSKLNMSDAMALARSGNVQTMGEKNISSTTLPTISQSVHLNMGKPEQLDSILLDSSFNPTIQRQRRYSRSNVAEYQPPHRFQIPFQQRPYIDDSLRRRKKRGVRNGGPKVGPYNPETWAYTNPVMDHHSENDQGITFGCRNNGTEEIRRESTGSRTVQERTLPWTRRDTESGPNVQREFPPWVNNQGYYSPRMSTEVFRPSLGSMAEAESDSEDTRL